MTGAANATGRIRSSRGNSVINALAKAANPEKASQDFRRGCPRPSRGGCPEGEGGEGEEYRLNLRS